MADSTAGKFKRSQLNAAFRLIKQCTLFNALWNTKFVYWFLGQDCQSRVDFSEWFKSELKEESLFQAHKPCWKLYSHDSALQQLKTYQVFRERNIFRQQKERSLWDEILNVNLWKLKKRGRSNIVFDNHLIFFFSQNLHNRIPKSSHLQARVKLPFVTERNWQGNERTVSLTQEIFWLKTCISRTHVSKCGFPFLCSTGFQ